MQLIDISVECHLNTEFQALTNMVARRTVMESARLRSGDYDVSLQHIRTISKYNEQSYTK